MIIKVMLKDLTFFDNGFLQCENVKGYTVNEEKGFLEICYENSCLIHINLDEIAYFKVLNKG